MIQYKYRVWNVISRTKSFQSGFCSPTPLYLVVAVHEKTHRIAKQKSVLKLTCDNRWLQAKIYICLFFSLINFLSTQQRLRLEPIHDSKFSVINLANPPLHSTMKFYHFALWALGFNAVSAAVQNYGMSPQISFGCVLCPKSHWTCMQTPVLRKIPLQQSPRPITSTSQPSGLSIERSE